MKMDVGGAVHDPKWSLERRDSSGLLIWRKEGPQSKIRFRFDVEVLEFEKHPHEDYDYVHDNSLSISSISSTIVLYASCVALIAASFFVPWYIMEKATGI